MTSPTTFEQAHGLLWRADAPFVPARWYAHVANRQRLLYETWPNGCLDLLPDGELPVLLRGGRDCRVRKHGNARCYLVELARRFVRRRRVTCLTRGIWFDWISANLAPLLRQHPCWWQQYKALGDICGWVTRMPGEDCNDVLVDGRPYSVSNAQYAALARISQMMRRSGVRPAGSRTARRALLEGIGT